MRHTKNWELISKIKDANGNKIYFEDNEGTIRAYLQTAMLDTELMKDKERLDWLMEVMEALQEHLNRIQRENAELRKDKERLDWVLSHEGRYWLSFREDIDREMKGTQ